MKFEVIVANRRHFVGTHLTIERVTLPSIHDMFEKTIKYSNQINGIGLHTGQPVTMTLFPAPENHGVVFKKKNNRGGVYIPATCEFARESALCTTLTRDGNEIQTVEHLLSAINAMDIDNILIEIDGDEVPILDGSAKTYIDLFKQSGRVSQKAKRQYIQVLSPVSYTDGDASLTLLPAHSSKFTCRIDFENCPVIGSQEMAFHLNTESFIDSISYARTFGFYEDHAMLKSKGLAQGASLENTVVIDKAGCVMNSSGLRDRQEFIKHKILDAVGDITLAGKKIMGHFKGHRPGHRNTYLLLKELFSRPDCWRYITI